MVESQLDDAFDESDLESLESVAFQVATGIEHARLLQKTRELAIVDERTRLARDMHDGVAQNLAYLLIQVDRSLNLVEEDSKLETQLELIGTVLKQNIEELRRNIFDLRPVDLEGKSLFDVLENFVTEFGRRWSLKTDCRVQGEAKDMPPEVERCLYRILQESLSNARQHAQCTQLWVEVLVKDNQTVSLEVRDDGRGFEMDQPSGHVRRRKGKGLGLVSMRERAEDVAGQLHVESARGQGTRIYAELPLDNRVADDDDSRST
jgi:signal transduction histidine kinase